jgi:transposase
VIPEAFLPDAKLEIVAVEIESASSTIQLRLRSSEVGAICPYCGEYSQRVHSEYERRLKDLPCSGHGVNITLEVRRFFCKAAACSRKTFSERLPEVTQPYARQTTRLRGVVQALALLVGSSMGKRLLGLLQVPTSIWAILRLLRKGTAPARPTPRILGVDDWAMRRGHRYGTLLVNLETADVVDILPGREAQTLADWLRAHPGVEVISRDRAEAYADGARLGAPNAIQVADRWHLLKNLGEMLVRVLAHHHRELKALAKTLVEVPTQSVPIQAQIAAIQEENEPSVNPNSRRYARFVETHALHEQGFTISAIASQTGLDRKTVRKYLSLTALPAYRPQRRRFSKLLPYQPYLLEHWQNGRRTVRQLWLDIRELGFKGSHSVVATFMARVRKERGLPPYVRTALQCPVAPPVLSPRRAAWLLLARPDQLSQEDLRLRAALPNLHPDIQNAARTAQHFAQIVRDRLPDAFDEWLLHSLQSALREVRSFARGIQRDYHAVKAALTLPWSNGMVEGHVNRIKFVKRQMFGRANFDLLRLRVLA